MTIASKISFGLGGGLDISQTEALTERIERAGFRGAWFSENNVSDAFTQIAAICRSTKKLRFGTSVAGIYGRSPMIMAMSAAALANVSQGRFVLGLGAQMRESVEQWHNGSSFDPQNMMVEYVTVVRGLLEGKRVTFGGQHIKAEELEIISKAKFPTKIFIAAIGPKMVQTAGKVADGVIGTFWSPKYVKEIVIPNLKIGATESGRSHSDLEILCTSECLPTENGASDFEAIKPHILMVATVPFFERIFTYNGFKKELDRIKERMAVGDIDGALETVSQKMVHDLEIAGDRDSVRGRVDEFLRAGLTELMIHPNVGNAFHPLHPKHLPETISKFSRPPLYSVARAYDHVISMLSAP